MFKRSRSPVPRGVSSPHRRSPRRRGAPPHRPATVAACLAALAGCGDSLVPDPPPSRAAPAAPTVVSGAGTTSDAAPLPPLGEVAAGLPGPGCVLHDRTLSDLYVEHRFGVAFSPSALRVAGGRLRLIARGVNVTVERPLAHGGTETLPARLGVRAVCRVPDAALGESEAQAWIDALLRERGLLGTPAAAADAPARSARPAAPGPGVAPDGTVTVCEGWGGQGEIGVTCVNVTVTCPAGFDYEASSGSCRGPGGRSSPPGTVNTGGSGGGNNNNNNQPTARTVAFALSCPAATRGSSGSCSVSAPGEDLGTLEFAWSSTAGGRAAATRGRSSWSGTAISEVGVTVTISDPAGAIAGATESATAPVTPRSWTFAPPTPAGTASGYGGAGWPGGKWGQHDAGSTTVPGVLEGTGPWEGLYAGDAAPAHNGDNAITLHADFDATGAAYPGANVVPCFAATSSDASANVVAVNAACGTSSQLSIWEASVLAHEADHAASGDRCLRSATTANKIRELEAIMGNDVDTVRDALRDKWEEFWDKIVLPAFEGRLRTPRSPVFWEHRFHGSWNRHALLGGSEGGTKGC